MKTHTFHFPWQRGAAWTRGLALVTLAAGAWALSSGTAHARGGNDLYWSIGVSQPGVSVGVSNAPPPRVVYREPVVVYQEPVVVYQPPRVVYQQPRVVYQQPRVVYQQPVVVAPVPVYYGGRGYSRYDERRAYKRERWERRHGYDRRGWYD